MGRRVIVNLEEKILSAVLRMNANEGIAKISTKDLAKKQGISEPVIFAHFETKQGLLDASFEYAWKLIYSSFGQPVSLLAKDPAEGFKIYQEKTDFLLKQGKMPLLYVYDYLNSSFCHQDFADLVMKDTHDAIENYFRSQAPHLTEYDLDLIAKQNIHLSLIYLVDIFRKKLVRSERSDAIYYTLRRNGYLALLQSDLSAYQEPKQ
jgi:AcrR family transcriptional regulator